MPKPLDTKAPYPFHVAIRYRLTDGRLVPWLLRDGARTLRIEPVARLVLGVNALDRGLCFARTGLGIIGAFRNWLDGDFKSGRLVPVLPNCWHSHAGPRLYYPTAPRPRRWAPSSRHAAQVQVRVDVKASVRRGHPPAHMRR